MKKSLFTVLLLLMPLWVSAQQLTITTDTIGQLARLLPDSNRYSVEELKICGPLNGNDVKTIQLITNRVRPKKANERLIRVLDLSEATITESKGSYRMKADVLPAGMFLNCKSLEKVILPNSTAEVSRSCFSGCLNLQEVVIPEGTEIINDYAFFNCGSLKEVHFPQSLTTIKNHAFDGCVLFTEIEIPSNVTQMEVYAFNNCRNLQRVNILGNINRLSNYAFASCSSLQEITIPSSVTLIGNCAFKFCSALANIQMPETISEIGSNAFEDCVSLKDIEISTASIIGSEAFKGYHRHQDRECQPYR